MPRLIVLLLVLAIQPSLAAAQESVILKPPAYGIGRVQAAAPGLMPRAALPAMAPDRGRSALIGGALGAAAGILLCTAFSTISNDSADGGFSTCTAKGYVLFGATGAAVGAGLGLVLGGNE